MDDDKSIRELFCEQLLMSGVETDSAGSATEALELVQKNTYGLITLDFRMPNLDGSKFHFLLSKGFGYGKKISSLIPQRIPPVLVVTGCADDPQVQKLLNGENVVAVLQKPVTQQQFTSAVTAVLHQAEKRESHRRRLAKTLAPYLARRRA